MADYIDWPGKSGKTYRYFFLSDTTASAIKAEAGNYMYVKEVRNGFVPVYIGQATDLRSRIPNHERLHDAIAAGATRVMAHTSSGSEQSRLEEERDLIMNWHPQCNIHHKPAA